MKHTKEEIINALKVIKEECRASEECKECPFCDDSIDYTTICMFDRPIAPAEWGISDIKPETWRAFK